MRHASCRAALPVMLTVDEVRSENPETTTLFLSLPDSEDAPFRGLDIQVFEPGQFFMLWIPGLDEKPYTLSGLDDERLAITVHRRGPFSTRLCLMKPGEKVGLRGPYGRGFQGLDRFRKAPHVALIGGGCGMATIALLAERLPAATVVQGARSADMVLYRDRFPSQIVFTDDGSAGRKGFPTAWLEERLSERLVDAVCACGPEPMLAAVVRMCLAANVHCQVSLERYMKCGVGVCGQCECDGYLVCKDGPVFTAQELADMPSFGRLKRDKAGRLVPVDGADFCPQGSPGATGG